MCPSWSFSSMGSRDNCFSMPKLMMLKVHVSMMHHGCVVSVLGGAWSCHLLQRLTSGKVVISMVSFLELHVCEQTGLHFENLDVPGIFHPQIPSEIEDRKRLLWVQQELGPGFLSGPRREIRQHGLENVLAGTDSVRSQPCAFAKVKNEFGPNWAHLSPVNMYKGLSHGFGIVQTFQRWSCHLRALGLWASHLISLSSNFSLKNDIIIASTSLGCF